MYRRSIAALTALLALTVALTSNADVVEDEATLEALRSNFAQLQAGINAGSEDDCVSALTILEPAANAEVFERHPRDLQRVSLHHIARCARLEARYSLGIPYIRRLIELDAPNAASWLRELIYVSTWSDQAEIAVDAVKSLGSIDAEALNQTDVNALFTLHGLVNGVDDGGELKFDYLQTLFDVDYEPAHPFYTSDEFMIDYALMLADRGDTSSLRKIVLGFRDPAILVRVLIDKRFQEVTEDSTMRDFLDLDAAAQREIDRVARLVEEHPEYAIGRVFLAKAYSTAWRFEEALEVIEPVAWTLMNPLSDGGFVDVDFSKRWVMSEYSDTLQRLKYPEQSAAMYEEAVDLPDFNVGSVYTLINLLGKALYGGHLQETHDVARALDLPGISLHYQMWVHSTIVCTNVLGPRISDYSSNQAFLIEHERENPSALIQALMCQGDMDGAARHMIRRLEDPGLRMNGLLYLQYDTNYEEYAAERRTHVHATWDGETPGHILWHRFDVLREREDVRRAVDRVGRIMVVPLHESSWHRY